MKHNPIKKPLSKAQRITRAQLPQASEEARIAGQNLRIMRGDPARFKGVTSRLTDEKKIQFYKDLLAQKTAAQKTTSSIPSSRVKKVPKQGNKKFVGPYSPLRSLGGLSRG